MRSCPTRSARGPTTRSGTRACAPAASPRAATGAGFEDILGAFFGQGDPLFSELFGFGRRGPAAAANAVAAEIELADVLEGISRRNPFEAVSRCEHCNGNGAEPGTPIQTCETCGGQGSSSRSRERRSGRWSARRPVRPATASSKILTSRAPSATAPDACAGSALGCGHPRGDRGPTTHQDPRGHAGEHGAPPGDLYVEVRESVPTSASSATAST